MLEVFDKMLALVERLRGAGCRFVRLDLGGGLGVPYKPGEVRRIFATYRARHVRTGAGA